MPYVLRRWYSLALVIVEDLRIYLRNVGEALDGSKVSRTITVQEGSNLRMADLLEVAVGALGRELHVP